jgi:hypothetical protein
MAALANTLPLFIVLESVFVDKICLVNINCFDLITPHRLYINAQVRSFKIMCPCPVLDKMRDL